MEQISRRAALVRAFVFGVEDSVVSTVGLLSGIVVGDLPRGSVILTGIVLIFVEAFSMGVGEFLSESSADDYAKRGNGTSKAPIFEGLLMFVSYLIAGFVVLAPYVFLPMGQALWASIGASLVMLFLLGAVSAKISNARILRSALRMCIIGGVALGIGILSATIFKGVA